MYVREHLKVTVIIITLWYKIIAHLITIYIQQPTHRRKPQPLQCLTMRNHVVANANTWRWQARMQPGQNAAHKDSMHIARKTWQTAMATNVKYLVQFYTILQSD